MSLYQIEANTEVYNYQLKVIAFDQYIDNLEACLMSQSHSKRDGRKLYDEIKRVKREKSDFIKNFTRKLRTENNKIDKQSWKCKWYHNFLEKNFKDDGVIPEHTVDDLVSKPLWMSAQFNREVVEDEEDL